MFQRANQFGHIRRSADHKPVHRISPICHAGGRRSLRRGAARRRSELERSIVYHARPNSGHSASSSQFFHRNTDYDEFLLYHDGDFLSKGKIKPGYATLHQRGIHHGPHPKALANQKSKTHTDEYAVVLDGLNPIHVLPPGDKVEWQEYWASWMENK